MSCQPPTLGTPITPEIVTKPQNPSMMTPSQTTRRMQRSPPPMQGRFESMSFWRIQMEPTASKEYIEFVNTACDEDINVDGWTVTDGQGTVRHTFSGTLPVGEAVKVLFDQGEHSALFPMPFPQQPPT